MNKKNQNPDDLNWEKLLDLLEMDRQAQGTLLSDAERQQLEELRVLLATTENALSYYALLDVDQGWAELRTLAVRKQLISPEPHRSQTKPVPMLRYLPRWVAVAGVLLVLAFASYHWYQISSQMGVRTLLTEAHNIEAGGQKARLILADGESIELREDVPGIAILANGITYLDGQPLAADLGTIEWLTIEVPRTGQYQVELPDGTRVWLNSESTLSYPAQFSGEKRQVDLSGEAYFEVAHNPDQPFVVNTSSQEISVLGTHFNVQAYLDEPVSRTTLLEGSVRVRQMHAQESVVLSPGKQAWSDFHQLKVLQADVDQVMAWKQGKFAFHGQELDAIMRQISRWYDVDVQFADPRLRGLKFGGTVSRENTLATVLEAMGNTGRLSFDLAGKTLIVKNAN